MSVAAHRVRECEWVAAALKLGYQGRWMQRTGSGHADVEVPAVTSVAELIELC